MLFRSFQTAFPFALAAQVALSRALPFNGPPSFDFHPPNQPFGGHDYGYGGAPTSASSSGFSASTGPGVPFSMVYTTAYSSAVPSATASAALFRNSSAAAYSSPAAVSTPILGTSVAVAASSAPVADVSSVAEGNSSAASVTIAGDACTVTAFDDVASATASCTEIVLDGITVPGGSTLDLSELNDGTTVIFSGTTNFGYYDWDDDLVQIGGKDITITATSDAIIDGNGQAWWDGEGSNGGKTKPDHFIVLNSISGDSLVTDLYIQNWPTHCFAISDTDGLTISNIVLNNTAGDAANSDSDGDPAGHNTDGFDIESSTNMVLKDSTVYNQDDCVAITSGTNIKVSGMYCSGGHGLSIGSIGGKSDNNVTDVVFTSSTVTKSDNGCRIKTNYDTTGYVGDITYSDITLSSISDYGIDIQQDYENGGATGTPSNGVTITGITMTNVKGTVEDGGVDYYILCGDGSCSDFTFNSVDITGGSDDSCNYTPSGDFSC